MLLAVALHLNCSLSNVLHLVLLAVALHLHCRLSNVLHLVLLAVALHLHCRLSNGLHLVLLAVALHLHRRLSNVLHLVLLPAASHLTLARQNSCHITSYFHTIKVSSVPSISVSYEICYTVCGMNRIRLMARQEHQRFRITIALGYLNAELVHEGMFLSPF